MTHKSYKKLMEMLDDGRCEINAWSDSKGNEPTLADVTFYNRQGNVVRRESVEVTCIPAELSR